MLSQNTFSRSPQIPAMCPPQINGPRSLRDFGLREIQLLYTRFLLECFTRSPRSDDVCSSKSTVTIPSGIRGSEISTFQPFLLPLLLSGVSNRLTRVSQNQMVEIHFGFSGFGSLNSQLSLLAFSRSVPTGVHDLLTCVLL
jgi:hypothetical protein